MAGHFRTWRRITMSCCETYRSATYSGCPWKRFQYFVQSGVHSSSLTLCLALRKLKSSFSSPHWPSNVVSLTSWGLKSGMGPLVSFSWELLTPRRHTSWVFCQPRWLLFLNWSTSLLWGTPQPRQAKPFSVWFWEACIFLSSEHSPYCKWAFCIKLSQSRVVFI